MNGWVRGEAFKLAQEFGIRTEEVRRRHWNGKSHINIKVIERSWEFWEVWIHISNQTFANLETKEIANSVQKDGLFVLNDMGWAYMN